MNPTLRDDRRGLKIERPLELVSRWVEADGDGLEEPDGEGVADGEGVGVALFAAAIACCTRSRASACALA